jgi:hypothetical protein
MATANGNSERQQQQQQQQTITEKSGKRRRKTGEHPLQLLFGGSVSDAGSARAVQ